MTRAFLRSIGRALIGVLLGAQMAIAAHACPGTAVAVTVAAPMATTVSDSVAGDAAGTASGATAAPRAVDCESMAGANASGFANLCAEHCHRGQQSDQAATLSVPAAILTALYLTPRASQPVPAPRLAADATSARAAAAPPHAILHCCFRI